MAMDKHASVKPSHPRKPPAVPPTQGESGQAGIRYGAGHKIVEKDPNRTEFPK